MKETWKSPSPDHITNMTKYDITPHPVPLRESAFVVWAIFADYDGMAPDTRDLLFLASKELAAQVAVVLNDDTRKWANLAYCESYESSKAFTCRKVWVGDLTRVRFSVAEVFEKDVELDEDYTEREPTRTEVALEQAEAAGVEVKHLSLPKVAADDFVGLPEEEES